MLNRLQRITQAHGATIFHGSLIGIEKESLRVSSLGGISQKNHPVGLGSALAHPYITTDYSEALLEWVTPPMADKSAILAFLRDAHTFVYSQLSDEFIWATSMPCVLAGETSIPIARYGSSNLGQMKTIYRKGLGLRYSKVMQVIAGVHFNYSLSDNFWLALQDLEHARGTLRAFKSTRYFDLIRNLQRFGWLIPYLFGASPAVCKSFFGDNESPMPAFDTTTRFQPFATSLRMGDIGYQNNQEFGIGVKANYDNLQSYIASLTCATQTPCAKYEKIGIKVAGQYQQLNANILQIENEYYSTVRPKQLVDHFEKPSLALQKRGVQYIELRSLDVNAYDPIGINEDQLYFLEALMIFCLLMDSPLIAETEKQDIDRNLSLAAHQGRDPELSLRIAGQSKLLQTWANEILTAMAPICACLDETHQTNRYSQVLAQQKRVASHPHNTPSARILQEMRDNDEGFFQFALRKSTEHQDYFKSLRLSDTRCKEFRKYSAESIARQDAIEAAKKIDFDAFLQQYFAQR